MCMYAHKRITHLVMEGMCTHKHSKHSYSTCIRNTKHKQKQWLQKMQLEPKEKSNKATCTYNWKIYSAKPDISYISISACTDTHQAHEEALETCNGWRIMSWLTCYRAQYCYHTCSHTFPFISINIRQNPHHMNDMRWLGNGCRQTSCVTSLLFWARWLSEW